jgi:hypothetical protein
MEIFGWENLFLQWPQIGSPESIKAEFNYELKPIHCFFWKTRLFGD